MEATAVALENGLAAPAAYVPSRELERHRQLAEVGAIVAPTAGGTLFCQRLPVRVREPRLPHDTMRSVVVRVSVSNLPEGTAGPQSMAVEVYDDREPTALLRREVDRQSFNAIKEEQRLLVSFQEFPQTLVQLLYSCAGPTADGGEAEAEAPEEEQGVNYAAPSRSKATSGSPEDPSTPAFPAVSSSKAAAAAAAAADHGVHLVALLTLRAADGPSPSGALNARPLAADVEDAHTPHAAFHRWSLHGQSDPTVCEVPTGSGVRASWRSFSEGFAQATLFLIETNNYRELTHLHLLFDRCTALETLRHAAQRMSHYKLYSLSLEHELCRVDAHRRQWAHLFRDLRERALHLLEQAHTTAAGLQQRLDGEAADHERALAAAAARNAAAVEELRGQLSAAQNENSALTQKIRKLEKEVARLEETLSADAREERKAQERVESLESALLKAKAERDSVATALRRSQTGEAELQSELTRLKELAAEDAAAEAADKEKRTLKEREKKLKQALSLSTEEIEKGNAIIVKLQTAVRKERENAQRYAEAKTELAAQLESQLTELRRSETSLSLENKRLQSELESVTNSNRLQQQRIDALERRLTQSTIESVLGAGSSAVLPPISVSCSLRPSAVPRPLPPPALGPQGIFLGADSAASPPVPAERPPERPRSATVAAQSANFASPPPSAALAPPLAATAPPAPLAAKAANNIRSNRTRSARSVSPGGKGGGVRRRVVEVVSQLPTTTGSDEEEEETTEALACLAGESSTLSFGRGTTHEKERPEF